MADNQICCAVHTLVEDIQSGVIMVKPYAGNLMSLERGLPGYDEPSLPGVLSELRRDATAIMDAHKFDFSSWRSDTTALSDVLLQTGQDMVNHQIAALPYPDVVFCQRIQVGEGAMELALLVSERWIDGVKTLSFRAYVRILGHTSWFFGGYTTRFRYLPAGSEWTTEWIANPAADRRLVDELGDDYADHYVNNHTCFCLSALAALSSRGPEIRVQPAPDKLNKQRAKKGKPPIFEYHIVEIPLWAKEKAEALGGTHASPRLHWRRGHERRLGEGRKTFVQAHLVGVAENGFINKDYTVPGPKTME